MRLLPDSASERTVIHRGFIRGQRAAAQRGRLVPKLTKRRDTAIAKYRSALPQLVDDFFMTDGGLETTLIFLEGQDLPHFAAFDLFKAPEGEGVLRKYFLTYAFA